jgi:hypothetical protein
MMRIAVRMMEEEQIKKKRMKQVLRSVRNINAAVAVGKMHQAVAKTVPA